MTTISSEIGRAEIGARPHPLIVHSHLRWDFVWQRPQQLMSRFARSAPVLFVEEPVYLDDVATHSLEITTPLLNVYRAVPKLSGALRDNYDASVSSVRDLVMVQIGAGSPLEGLFSNAVQWFYTPMPAPAMLGAFNEVGVVYDCMDELAQFRHAPPDLLRRERLLIQNADVIFTGGYRLYTAKSALHPNVHFFGCGVDVAHFSRARDPETSVPADGRFDSPVAGYFGVIDERLDYDLIRALAEQHSELDIVMVGPTAKVSPAELPTAANIHWLGQRSYEDLPGYVKGFDVCLMPFALNEATEYINPTKTLEYMAAGKPIVSTAVADVVRNFTPIVTVSESQEDFISKVLHCSEHRDSQRIADGIEMATENSWESTIHRMRALVTDAVDKSPLVASEAETRAATSSQAELPAA